MEVNYDHAPFCVGCPQKDLAISVTRLCDERGVVEEQYSCYCRHMCACASAVNRQKELEKVGATAVAGMPMPEVKPPKRTNWDRLKEMPLEAIARWFIVEAAFDSCPPHIAGRHCGKLAGSCTKCWTEWLESEVTEDVH